VLKFFLAFYLALLIKDVLFNTLKSEIISIILNSSLSRCANMYILAYRKLLIKKRKIHIISHFFLVQPHWEG